MDSREEAHELLQRLGKGDLTFEEVRSEFGLGPSIAPTLDPGAGLALSALLPFLAMVPPPTPTTVTASTSVSATTPNGTTSNTVTIASPSHRVTTSGTITTRPSYTVQETIQVQTAATRTAGTTFPTTVPPPATPPHTAPRTDASTVTFTEGITQIQDGATTAVTILTGRQTITVTRAETIPTTASVSATTAIATTIAALPQSTFLPTAAIAGSPEPQTLVVNLPEGPVEIRVGPLDTGF
jgi:hypothetical protein